MATIVKDKIDKACDTFKVVHKSNCRKFNKLDDWLAKESMIFYDEVKNKNDRQKYRNFKRGEIIKADFGVNLGSEFSHTHFAIILNSDDSTSNDNVTVLPLTSKPGYKKVNLGNLMQRVMPNTQKYISNSYGCITQVKTISKSRIFITKFKYICDKDVLNIIDKAIIKYLTS